MEGELRLLGLVHLYRRVWLIEMGVVPREPRAITKVRS